MQLEIVVKRGWNEMVCGKRACDERVCEERMGDDQTVNQTDMA